MDYQNMLRDKIWEQYSDIINNIGIMDKSSQVCGLDVEVVFASYRGLIGTKKLIDLYKDFYGDAGEFSEISTRLEEIVNSIEERFIKISKEGFNKPL